MEAATLEAPVPVQQAENPAPVTPQPSVAEILDQHLDHSQQKKIAVENLSSIKFLIAPDGKSAISAGTVKNEEQRQIVEASLTALIGVRPEDAPHLAGEDGLASKLGLLSSGEFVKIEGAATLKKLAEAGVKDFAAALGEKQHSHTGHAR
jgi:hypothetical protein